MNNTIASSIPALLLCASTAFVTGIIAVASLSPQAPAVATGFSDTVDHLAVYACLGLLLTLDWSRRTSGPVIMAAGAAVGAVLELLQALVPGRQPDWGDVASTRWASWPVGCWHPSCGGWHADGRGPT